jgi:tetratricopeptide (TPR) repeat protein
MPRAASLSARDVKDRAHALALKGRLEAAVKLIRQHLERQQGDAVLWLRHAELLRKLKRTDSAVTSYRRAAKLLEEEGHLPRARAALVCAQEIAPNHPQLLRDLARLSDEQDGGSPVWPASAEPLVEGVALPLRGPPPARPGLRAVPLDEADSPTDPYCPLFDWLPDPA